MILNNIELSTFKPHKKIILFMEETRLGYFIIFH